MVDEGKSVSASYSHYCPVFVSDNGHALSYRFGWEWTSYALPSSQSEQHRTQAQQIPTSVSTPVDANTFLRSQEDIEVITATLAAVVS